MTKTASILIILSTLAFPCIGSAEWLFGVKAGSMLVKFDDAKTDKNPVNAGIVLGYEFDSVVSGLALEFDITRSIAPGTVVNADLTVDSQGIYISYRTNQQLYFKARLGIMKASLSGSLAEDEGGETYGVAVGLKLSALAVELDYTSIDDDIGFISVGALYRF